MREVVDREKGDVGVGAPRGVEEACGEVGEGGVVCGEVGGDRRGLVGGAGEDVGEAGAGGGEGRVAGGHGGFGGEGPGVGVWWGGELGAADDGDPGAGGGEHGGGVAGGVGVGVGEVGGGVEAVRRRLAGGLGREGTRG